MRNYDCECMACKRLIEVTCGQPYVDYKHLVICDACAMNLMEPIYQMGGVGGLQHIIVRSLLESPHNRTKRRQIKNYQQIFEKLLHKYKFCCVQCQSKEKLSIDHIKPVARGGCDDFENLQILCKSCNSKKGAKYAVV